MTEHRVNVANGKYTFIMTKDYRLDILRNNEPWIYDVGSVLPGCLGCLLGAMAELDAARVVLAAVKLSFDSDPKGMPSVVREALMLHMQLVDDHEPPSAWTIHGDDHPLRNPRT